ncbi:MAG: hypothetical protein JOZ10_04900 [Acidobacteria bacterium]|nr:hypothetical protein [Acidobacteriota bacterium]MBV9144840.1 hypothetical protein [Acidobacteriota bacterium]
MRIVGLMCCTILGATVMTAQSTSNLPHARNPKSQHVRESLLASNQSRMQWEASALFSAPLIPGNDAAEHHAIHIEDGQVAPALPKLRRELLAPVSPKVLTSAK